MNQQVKIVLFIFPKEKFNRTRLDDILTYPLAVFNKTKKIMEEKRLYNKLKKELLEKLDSWEKFKPIRGKIEDFFKLLKQGLNMREIHKYTPKSVEKNSLFECIFRSTDSISRILFKNGHITII